MDEICGVGAVLETLPLNHEYMAITISQGASCGCLIYFVGQVWWLVVRYAPVCVIICTMNVMHVIPYLIDDSIISMVSYCCTVLEPSC